MWNITKEAKDTFAKNNLLPIHESDEEWEIAFREAEQGGEDLVSRLVEKLNRIKAELHHVLPSRFIPYLEDGSLKSTDPTPSHTRRLSSMDERIRRAI